MAPVSGFARSFIMGTALSHATITILETGQKITTDNEGSFGPFRYPVGKPITLQIEEDGYKTTQTGTFIVPAQGLVGKYNQITFQVPSLESFYLLKAIVGGEEHAEDCHVTTTITAYHMTMDDDPQGEAGAIMTIAPQVKEKPFYFDMFTSGPFKGKTNPFTKNLTATTEDGGAAYFNLPPRKEPYLLSAMKKGVKFSQVTFFCRPGAFINISPPNGPAVIANSHDDTASTTPQ